MFDWTKILRSNQKLAKPTVRFSPRGDGNGLESRGVWRESQGVVGGLPDLVCETCDGFFLMPSHIAVLFCPKIANGHEAEASCFLFYAFDLFSNCSFLEISRLIAYSNRLFFKKYLSSITRVPCMSASHHDTSPLVYNIYVLKL